MADGKRSKKGEGKKGFDARALASAPRADTDELELVKRENARLERALRMAHGGESFILSAIDRLVDEFPKIVPPRIPPKRRGKQRHHEIAVAHLSDTHIGKVTISYGTEVARERINRFAAKIVEIAELRRHTADIDDLRLYLGGDLIEGEEIFAHQAHLIEDSLLDQAVRKAPSILAAVISFLSENFRSIRVVGVPGNHGRNGPYGGGAHPMTNWDRVCYHTTQLLLRENKRVEFVLPEEEYAIDRVYEWGNLVVHGHQFRGKLFGPAMIKKILTWVSTLPERFDYVWCGHLHTYAEAPMGAVSCFVNGSTESDNDHALMNFGASHGPRQRLVFFNRKYGPISYHPIRLGGGAATDDE